ncbi:uncharacterized protein LOC116974348 [Amblyraja radiata]|uniref:uncharacterized protein LOC116974348 n=1 Tax=Amblyraja radiata TaxID=386614 RepID=UPI00140345D8|nr:uncharacterized protein LOC116974348 [Amblyraja radiata]
MEINENFQKDEPKINNVVSPVILHHSAASVIDITKNTSQHGTTKVTDIYHRRRPSNRFKLDFLQRAKSVPSSPEMTEQWQSDNILFFSYQEKLKSPPQLSHNINLLQSDGNVEKWQAVSSKDEVNEQYTLTNTAHDSKDTSQKCPVDGITVNRWSSNDCDPPDGCEIKRTPSPLNPDPGQLLHVDTSLNNQHMPTGQVLNTADDAGFSKRPDNQKIKRADLSGTLEISPTSTAHSNKNKSLYQSSNIADTVLSKRIDEFNATHILPMLRPVISQKPSNSSFKMLSDLLNNGTVGAKIETAKISTVDSLTGFQTVLTMTDIHENLGQDYLTRDFDIFHDELTNEKSNIKRLHKTNDALPSPKAQYITTNISKNQDKQACHSAWSDGILMGRSNKSNAKDCYLLPTSQQAPSGIIKNKQSLIHSALRSDFEMNVADVKNVTNGQLQNRDALLQSPTGLKYSSDTTCRNNIQFQNSSPKKDMCSRKSIGIKSTNDTNLALPDLLTEQESPDDLTYNKSNKYLNEPMEDRDATLDRRWKDICAKTEKYLISSGSTPPDSPPGQSPQNKYIRKNYSTDSCDISPQDIDVVKENKKVFRYRRKSFPGRMLEYGRSGTCTTNIHTFNSLQHCYLKKQIGSEFIEINDLHNRLNTNSDFSQHRVNSISTDKDDNSSVNNNDQTGAARFSNYSRFKSSQISQSHNVQNRYGHLFRPTCLKDINSHCNLLSQPDQENVLSTNIRHEPKLTTQKRQAVPFPSFLSYTKRSRLYGSYPDLSFCNRNEFNYNICSSYHDRQDNDELINRNEDKSNISKKEAVKKDTYLENKKHGRECKPEFHKKAASRSIEDVFDPFPSEVTQDLGMDDETVTNNEYFPVDIKMFWPKENPTDIIRLLSSTSTGSKMSEESLSPQSHRVPAEIWKPNLSCYSETDSDTTTDDEYFLDCNETAKESAL